MRFTHFLWSSCKPAVLCLSLLMMTACQILQTESRLYDDLGGQAGIENIADRFVRLMISDPRTQGHFEDTNLDRLFEKLVEQICELSDGPCEYTGDSMVEVHKGMNISEREFNATVEILQQAMRDNDIPLGTQNRLLTLLAPMRSDMLYQ